MQFKTWLSLQKDRDDPVGDLARDAIQDPNRPLKLGDWREYLGNVGEAGACDGALTAFERAKTEYESR